MAPVFGYGYTELIPYSTSIPIDDFSTDYQTESLNRPNVWDYPFASVTALGVASFGVKNSWEYYYAVFGQFIYWLQGFRGLDGMTNAIIGIQFGRGSFKYAMFATLLGAYEAIDDLNRSKTLTYKSSTRIGIYAIGYLLGYLIK